MDIVYSTAPPLHDIFNRLWYILPLLLLAYCVADAISTRHLIRKQAELPLVGSSLSFVPKFILNLLYAWKATELTKQGYEKVC